MPDTNELDVIPEPAEPATAVTPLHRDGTVQFSAAVPDLMPLLDVAEERISFVMNLYESALRSTMVVSGAGLECGSAWNRGWREINAHAATFVWQTSQISLGASSDLLDRAMDFQVRSLDAAAAQLAEAA